MILSLRPFVLIRLLNGDVRGLVLSHLFLSLSLSLSHAHAHTPTISHTLPLSLRQIEPSCPPPSRKQGCFCFCAELSPAKKSLSSPNFACLNYFDNFYSHDTRAFARERESKRERERERERKKGRDSLVATTEKMKHPINFQ